MKWSYGMFRKMQNHKKKKTFWEDLIAHFPWYDTDHIKNDASKNSSIVAYVFVTAETFLPSRCLATIKGFFTEPLPSNDKVIFIEPLPSNNRGDTQTHTHRQQRDLIGILYFFKISMLKRQGKVVPVLN
jgi:hypothetical protein